MYSINNGKFSIMDLNTKELLLDSIPVTSPTITYPMSVNSNPSATLSMETCEFSQMH